MKHLSPIAALSLGLAMLPSLVFAHTGHAAGGNAFAMGGMHPMGGLDHLLAMVAVGLWAASLGGAARWALPTAFVGAMIFGAGLGLAGLALPMAEPAILASSILIGLALALAVKPGTGVALMSTATFGLMHGFAHGAEAPVAGVISFGLGFVLATAALHLSGLLLGKLAMHRWLGAATTAAGVALALG